MFNRREIISLVFNMITGNLNYFADETKFLKAF